MTKILLVEDDKSLREIYGVRLLAEGYDIVSAGDGEDALAMAIKERPELIVSDVMMPKISGFDMLDILRSTTETRDIKVIMMTALSSDDQRARGEQLGADRYLVKSQVGIEDVVRTVHEVLQDTPGAALAAPVPQTEPVTASEPVAPSEPVAAPTAMQVADEQDASGPGPLPPQPSVVPYTSTPVVPDPAPVVDPLAAVESESAPQPVETTEPAASTLPQPTAPFSSPRPATLGERIIHPLESAQPTVSSEVSSQIAQELQAAADPIAASQVNDAPALPPVQPAADPTASSYEETPRPNDTQPPQPPVATS
jgi:CheY-like chemotaxis protein